MFLPAELSKHSVFKTRPLDFAKRDSWSASLRFLGHASEGWESAKRGIGEFPRNEGAILSLRSGSVVEILHGPFDFGACPQTFFSTHLRIRLLKRTARVIIQLLGRSSQ